MTEQLSEEELDRSHREGIKHPALMTKYGPVSAKATGYFPEWHEWRIERPDGKEEMFFLVRNELGEHMRRIREEIDKHVTQAEIAAARAKARQ